jgi:hypothetical protein
VLEKIRRRVRKPCHLFGVWWQDTLADVAKEAQFGFVQGVDTPKPIRLAVRGLGLGEWDKMPRGRDFVDSHVNGADLDLLRRNCEGFVRICGGVQ